MSQLRQERDELLEVRRQVDEEVTTLRRKVQHHEQESKNRQSVLESKIMELESITKSLPKGASSKLIHAKHSCSLNGKKIVKGYHRAQHWDLFCFIID